MNYAVPGVFYGIRGAGKDVGAGNPARADGGEEEGWWSWDGKGEI